MKAKDFNLLILNYYLKKFPDYSGEIKGIIKLYKKGSFHKRAPLEYPVKVRNKNKYIERIDIHWNENLLAGDIIKSSSFFQKLIKPAQYKLLCRFIKKYYKKLGPELMFNLNFEAPSLECYFLGPINPKMFLKFKKNLEDIPLVIKFPKWDYNYKKLGIVGLEFLKRKREIAITAYEKVEEIDKREKILQKQIRKNLFPTLRKKLVNKFIFSKEFYFKGRAADISNNRKLSPTFRELIKSKKFFNPEIDSKIYVDWVGFSELGYYNLYFVSKNNPLGKEIEGK